MTAPLIVERDLLACISPQILNIELPLANTEYAFELPNGTRRFLFKTRDPLHTLKFSFEEGKSSEIYITLTRMGYEENNLLLKDLKIYFQSPSDNCVVECLIWY